MGRKGILRKGWGMSVAMVTVQYVGGGKLQKQWLTLFSAMLNVLSLIPGIHMLKGRREPSPANRSLISTCMYGTWAYMHTPRRDGSAVRG